MARLPAEHKSKRFWISISQSREKQKLTGELEVMQDISLHLLDILQNSVSAGASLIVCRFVKSADILRLSIEDDGKGMDEDTLQAALDPFYTSKVHRKKKVGLGIPLFAQSAKLSGGFFDMESTPGKGTKLEASFVLSSIDVLPLGDITATMINCVVAHPEVDFVLESVVSGEEECFDTRLIKKELDGVPLDQPEIRVFIEEMLNQQIVKLEEK